MRKGKADQIDFYTDLPRTFPEDVDPHSPILATSAEHGKGAAWVMHNFNVNPHVVILDSLGV